MSRRSRVRRARAEVAARRSRSSWTATAAGRRRAACRSRRAIEPDRAPCVRSSRPRSTSASSRLPCSPFRPRTGRVRQTKSQALMEIFGETIDRELGDLAKEGVRTRFVGRRDRAPELAPTKHGRARGCNGRQSRGSILWIASGSAGRAELVEAARRSPRDGVEPEDTRRRIARRGIFTRRTCQIRILVIRTSGELRRLEFPPWQPAYAESS